VGFARKLFVAGWNPAIPAFTTTVIEIYELVYGEVGERGRTKKQSMGTSCLSNQKEPCGSFLLTSTSVVSLATGVSGQFPPLRFCPSNKFFYVLLTSTVLY
jgi:hypothetical protein